MEEQCFYRVSVKGLTTDSEGRVLLAREESGVWEILGGGLDHDEDPVAGLKREIHEETGLKISKISSLPKYFTTFPKPNSKIYAANIFYEIELENLNFTATEECQELRFCSIEEMKNMNLLPSVEKLLEVLESQQSK